MGIVDRLRGKYYLFIVIAIVVVTYFVNLNIRLYGDDFFYIRFSKVDLSYYINRHTDHYIRGNGRAIVHIMATFFLALDLRVWQVFNSIMMGMLALFGIKAINSVPADFKSSNSVLVAVIFFASIGYLDHEMTRQSVYWLVGSFNYLYPTVMLLSYWYLLNKEKGYLLIIMAFFAAATVEQVGMMTFGLTLMTVLERKFLEKRQPAVHLIIALVVSFIGMSTVIFAPSVFLRASIENAPVSGFIPLLFYNIKIQGTTFLFSRVMMPYLIMSIISSIGVVYYYKDTLNRSIMVHQLIVIFSTSASLCWLWQMTSRNAQTSYFNITWPYGLFYVFTGIGISTLLFYAAILIYINKDINNYKMPLLSLILGFGSQIMLLVSPVYGYRNLFVAIIMLVLYVALVLPSFHQLGIPVIVGLFICVLFNKPWLLPIQAIAFYLAFYKNHASMRAFRLKLANYIGYGTIIIISIIVMQKSIYGYHTNAKVYDQNLEVANIYIENQNEIALEQIKLPYELYAWVMPYQNEYYAPYYNLYLGINQDTKIDWQE